MGRLKFKLMYVGNRSEFLNVFFGEISTIYLAMIHNTFCTNILIIRESVSAILKLTPKCAKVNFVA